VGGIVEPTITRQLVGLLAVLTPALTIALAGQTAVSGEGFAGMA